MGREQTGGGLFKLNFEILRGNARRGNGPQTAQGFRPLPPAPARGRHRDSAGSDSKRFCLRTPPASRGSLAAPVICTVFVAADLGRVRFAPKASQLLRGSEMTRCARTGCEQSQQNNPYSITSSAMASSPGGKLRPKALAVLRLITNSNLVDCMTGRSPGFSPLRIRPVYTPAWRYASLRLVP